MNEWIKGLVIFFLVVSIAEQMLPNKKYEQYVKLFTGLLLIVMLMQPILKIGSSDRIFEQKLSKLLEEQEALEQEIGKQPILFENTEKNQSFYEMDVIEIEEIHQVEVDTID